MNDQTSVAIGAVSNPLNFVWVNLEDDLDLELIAEQLGVEEIEIVDIEGPFYRVLREVGLSDLSRVHEVLCDGYEYGLHHYMQYLGIDYSLANLRSVERDCRDTFQGCFTCFVTFAEEQLEETMNVPDWLWPYIDVEKFARDLQHDFFYTETEAGTLVWCNR